MGYIRIVLFAALIFSFALNCNAQLIYKNSFPSFILSEIKYLESEKSILAVYATDGFNRWYRYSVSKDTGRTFKDIWDFRLNETYFPGAFYSSKRNFALRSTFFNSLILSYSEPFVLDQIPDTVFRISSLERKFGISPFLTNYSVVFLDNKPDKNFLAFDEKIFLCNETSGCRVVGSLDDSEFLYMSRVQYIPPNKYYFYSNSISEGKVDTTFQMYCFDLEREYLQFMGGIPQKLTGMFKGMELRRTVLFNPFDESMFVLDSSLRIIYKVDKSFASLRVVFDSRWSYGASRIGSFTMDPFNPNNFWLAFADRNELLKSTDGLETLYPVSFEPPIKDVPIRRVVLFSKDLMGVIAGDDLYISTNRGGSPYTGVDEADVLPRWNVYPNPVMDNLTIHGNHSGEARYAVCDMQGRELMNMSGKVTGQATIAVGHLSPGIYLLRISSAQGSSTLKFLKQ